MTDVLSASEHLKTAVGVPRRKGSSIERVIKEGRKSRGSPRVRKPNGGEAVGQHLPEPPEAMARVSSPGGLGRAARHVPTAATAWGTECLSCWHLLLAETARPHTEPQPGRPLNFLAQRWALIPSVRFAQPEPFHAQIASGSRRTGKALDVRRHSEMMIGLD